MPAWDCRFWAEGLQPAQGYLSLDQERATQAHFTKHYARSADEVCVYTLAEHGQSCSASGAAKLMGRLGFAYKKPQSLPAQADETKQAAFIAKYEALMTGLRTDEMVVFSTSRTCKHVLPGKGCSTSRTSKPTSPWLVHQGPKNCH